MDTVILSIIILNYNTKHLLRLMLKNLVALNLTISHEIIVVDNHSQDDSVKMVKKYFPQVRLIENDKNVGHAAGNNIGMRVAKGKYFLIINSDIIIHQTKALYDIIEYMEQHTDIGILGPKLLNGDGSVQYSCFRPYRLLTPIFRRTPLGKLALAKRDLARHLMTDNNHTQIQTVDWLLGAMLLIRAQAVQEHGFFNERFFLYFADYELCDRLCHYHYKVVYYPNVAMVHYHRRESADGSIWSGLGSLLNYTTRVHLTDWFTYLAIKQQGYDKNS
ncbi:MAG: glycosyltransferase family 2 protein [Patescibacteria group bacterium]|jgi:hypothetical protein